MAIDPPFRLSPFQNLVHLNTEQPSIFLSFRIYYQPVDVSWTAIQYGDMPPPSGGLYAVSSATSAAAKLLCYPADGQTFSGFPFTPGEAHIAYNTLPANAAIFGGARMFTTDGIHFTFEHGGICSDGNYVHNLDYPIVPGKLGAAYSYSPWPAGLTTFCSIALDFSGASITDSEGHVFTPAPPATGVEPIVTVSNGSGAIILPYGMWGAQGGEVGYGGIDLPKIGSADTTEDMYMSDGIEFYFQGTVIFEETTTA